VTAVCETYGYRLEHFYQRSFKQGGVTLSQLTVLFKHAQKREADRLKFQAALHGAKVDAAPETKPDLAKEKKPFMFGDPDDYAKMPMDVRKKLTEKMMGAHKRWGQNPISPRGKVKWG